MSAPSSDSSAQCCAAPAGFRSRDFGNGAPPVSEVIPAELFIPGLPVMTLQRVLDDFVAAGNLESNARKWYARCENGEFEKISYVDLKAVLRARYAVPVEAVSRVVRVIESERRVKLVIECRLGLPAGIHTICGHKVLAKKHFLAPAAAPGSFPRLAAILRTAFGENVEGLWRFLAALKTWREHFLTRAAAARREPQGRNVFLMLCGAAGTGKTLLFRRFVWPAIGCDDAERLVSFSGLGCDAWKRLVAQREAVFADSQDSVWEGVHSRRQRVAERIDDAIYGRSKAIFPKYGTVFPLRAFIGQAVGTHYAGFARPFIPETLAQHSVVLLLDNRAGLEAALRRIVDAQPARDSRAALDAIFAAEFPAFLHWLSAFPLALSDADSPDFRPFTALSAGAELSQGFRFPSEWFEQRFGCVGWCDPAVEPWLYRARACARHKWKGCTLPDPFPAAQN